MIRVYRSLRQYALDKISMQKRSDCFYAPQQPSYAQNTIQYAYNLALHPGSSYQGIADIRFNLQKKSSLFLDFQGKQIKQFFINSTRVDPSTAYKQGKINLPQNLLRNGQNNVCVKYENQYDKDGSGCVSFIDVDKKQYLYTQFQPYMGNRVFPMFDQPDLKAKMNLSIACPNQWQAVLSNQNQILNNANLSSVSPACRITQQILNKFKTNLSKNYKITSFNTTKLLPTYLFCFVVGPYKKFISKNTYKNIQMNLYCIQSLYPYMLNLVPFIEQMTNKSMQFFQQYFGYPYPFTKYDQVFAHQYKWGAMQNAGIVTLNDLYIFKDPVSTQKMISFGNTIIHQMAHHWFGNLVTMKWWDDLWLNQSFAQYISHFCLQKIKQDVKTINYQSAMASFLNRKSWGYQQDQLSTTHPIRSDVSNTQVAQSIFDGITYSKGAATMKQLMYLMGQDSFSKALKQYFHYYQFKNAELEHLLHYMKKYYKVKDGVSIDQWRQMWLEKAGLNILSCQFDQTRSVLKIYQTAYHKNHPTLRSHTIKIGLVQNPKLIHQIQVVVKPTPITQIKLSQSQLSLFKKSKAILLNYKDLTFCKVILDQKSIKYYKQNLHKIDDILFRTMIWKNFYDMVRDGHIKSGQYIQILVNNLFKQKSDTILQQNLNYAYTAIQKYTPLQYREQSFTILLQQCLQNTKNISKNRQIIIKDKIITFTNIYNTKQIYQLYNWYYENNSQLINNIGIPNITQRWKIVIKILNSSCIEKQTKIKLLQNMINRDNSDTMKNKKLTCNSLLLHDSQLLQHYNKHTSDISQNWSMTTYVHSLAGLNAKIHKKYIGKQLTQKYFQSIKISLQQQPTTHNLQVLKKSQMIQTFIQHMDPNIQDNITDLEDKVRRFSQIAVKNNDKIKIQLEKKIDLLRKRIKCFKLYK